MNIFVNKSVYLNNYNYQNITYKESSGMIADLWMCSSQEKAPDGKKFSGAYPAGFLKRMKEAFKDYYPKSREDVLHVCSGRIPKTEGIRLDIDPEYEPDIINDAEDMVEVKDESFSWVIADPPYNEEAAKRYYNKTLLNKSKMIREMTRVCKKDGFVCLLDQTSPNSVPRNLKRVALVGVTSLPNRDMRIFSVWRKIDTSSSEETK